ncbi:hypothetical protein IHE55_09390 [Streptomyces pactum]|uniref:Lipoprotein n=1 Tax=Streptomyces pactum TaxID=68249 RepID=A0ABS0NIK8_9ACTN|nr:hypothetical protein [Streptomyces pactum]MBH5334996.1 hypothetical protein [Streptomyces pactum]
MSAFIAAPDAPARRHRAPRAAFVLATAAVLAVLLTGCGQQDGSAPEDGRPPGGGASGSGSATAPATPAPPGADSRIDVGVAHFASAVGGAPEVRRVIRDRRELAAFADRFGARGAKIEADAADTDFSTRVLVGWSSTTGCAQWPSAALHHAGRGALAVLPGPHPAPPPECFAPYHTVAVFTVPRERLPENPHFTR